MKASTCRRPRCLNACQKWTSAFTFFLRYYLLKNPAIWFAGRILTHNSSIQKFVRYEIGCKISITILVFILDHLQRKAMSKFFKQCKKPYFEVILVLFCPNLDKNEFYLEKGLCQFLNIPADYHCAKYQKKLMGNSWEKCLNDGTDKQTGNFIVFSVGQGSNYQSNFKLFWIYINTPKTSLLH